jgi:hypothetical protein
VLNCDIAINNKYRCQISVSNFIKRFDTNPTFIILKEEEKRKHFYFDVFITDQIQVTFQTSVSVKNKDTLYLIVDRVFNCRIYSTFFTRFNPQDISFCKSLKKEDYIKYFEKSVITLIRSKNAIVKESVTLNLMYE